MAKTYGGDELNLDPPLDFISNHFFSSSISSFSQKGSSKHQPSNLFFTLRLKRTNESFATYGQQIKSQTEANVKSY